MIAYHGEAKIKEDILLQLEEHRAKDELIRGRYWEKGKGCAVGCTIHGSDHGLYEPRFGIPRTLAYLEDQIFERLPNVQAMAWPVAFMSAIRVGADLKLVWPRLALWMLRDELPLATKDEKILKVIEDVAKLYDEWIQTGVTPEKSRWAAAAAAAEAAEAAAAAAEAAEAAEAAAGRWTAAAAAREKFWIRASEQLLKLLAAA